MRNPILIELTRGNLVESAHAGAIALVRPDGETVAAVGDVAAPVFTRSAIKPLQAIPLVETGAADRFGFGAAELAIASGSHSGTAAHVDRVRAMLARAGLTETALACGRHEPIDKAATTALVRSGARPSTLHHNCSGKHAGMLATAVHLGEPTKDYWRPEYPAQRRIAEAVADLTGCTLGPGACGIDGCSVPNWATPLAGLARAFARFITGEDLPPERAQACRRIAEACWASPEMVAGPGRLDTLVLELLRHKVLLKAGAEGVYGGAFPEHGLGFALKIDDGAKRAAEAALVQVLERFHPQARGLGPPQVIHNWQGLAVGEVRAAPALRALLDQARPA